MDYKEKYNQALKRARNVYTYYCDDREQLRKIESIFPELKESEDEKAWLEKQGEQPTDKVEPKFKVGDWIIDEETPNDVFYVIGVLEEIYKVIDIDGQDYHIPHCKADKQFHLWSIDDAKDGDVLETDGSVFIYAKVLYNKPYAYCGVDKYGVFKDNCLENNWSNSVYNIHPATDKQRDQLEKAIMKAGYEWDSEKKELKKIEVASKEMEDERIRKGIISNLQYLMDRSEGFVKEDLQERIAWLEKQGEQPTDKVESYFKVGDWVILNGVVAKILDKQEYGFVGLDTNGKDFFCNYGHTDSMRLWSIDDANDGDVLVTEDYIFIFKYILHGGVHLYCHYNFDDEEFDVDIPDAVIGNIHDKGIHFRPATKEQRDLLFRKMKKEGYEWDGDKKELKKIEPKTLDPDKVIEWLERNAPIFWHSPCNPNIIVKHFKEDFGL